MLHKMVGETEYVEMVCVEDRYYTADGFKRIHEPVSELPFTPDSFPEGNTYRTVGMILTPENCPTYFAQ